MLRTMMSFHCRTVRSGFGSPGPIFECSTALPQKPTHSPLSGLLSMYPASPSDASNVFHERPLSWDAM